MSEQLTLYRGESGDPHLVAFRCAHRGTQLSTGWVEGDDLRCFYHGWKYGPDGQCVEQPAEPQPFCEKIRIRSYLVQEYLGLVFAYLGEGDPPPMWSFPEFEGDGILRLTGPQVWPCNYFNRIENSLDHVHGAFVHRRRVNGYGLGEIPRVLGYETEYGIKTIGIRQGHIRMQHFHIPNLNYRTPWAAPSAAAASEVDPEGGVSAREASSITNIEDYTAQVGQGAIADRENERLGRSDVLVILLRQLLSREMRNLAEGKPLKQWTRPASGQYEVSHILGPGEEPDAALLAPAGAPMLAPYR